MSKKSTGSKKKLPQATLEELVDIEPVQDLIGKPVQKMSYPNVLFNTQDLPNPPRFTVVVADTIQYRDKFGREREYKMEGGRQIAQACHVLSKQKMSYILQWSAVGQDVKNLVSCFYGCGVTTIVTKCRDSKELRHILDLAIEKNLLVNHFADTNPPVYETDEGIITALCIGPNDKRELAGVTDYLPLWKEGTAAVG